MCIRDRPHIKLAKNRGKTVRVFDLLNAARPNNAKPIVERFATACLLYTSDAADERSSVDLGGRRIIKKKNRVENETAETRTEIERLNVDN